MKTLYINVLNKKATYQKRCGNIVCGNSDYQIQFTFDSEWDDQPVKTARFVYLGKYIDVVFEGNVCTVPVIKNTTSVSVGVYAGNLNTTTPAIIPCVKSILCEDGLPDEPDEADDYYAQIAKMIEEGVGKTAYDVAVDNGFTGTEEEWLESLKGERGDFANWVEEEGSINLFNPNDPDLIQGGYIRPNQTIISVSSTFVTGYIGVQQGKTYTYSTNWGTYGGADAYNVLFYDVDKSPVGVIQSTPKSDNKNICSFTIDMSGVVYARVNGALTVLSTTMFVEGDEYPSEYIEYKESYYQLKEDVRISEKERNEIDTSINPLHGKKAVFIGDSICWGAGASGGYASIIAENNSMECINYGVSGATIKYEENSDMVISRNISSMDADADFCILEGGVNDNVTIGGGIGTLAASYDDELDDTTFYGAFESMLKQAIIRYAGKKIGYIFVHKMGGFDSRNTSETSRYYAAKKCLEKWGVPYLDLNTECPSFASFTEATPDLYALRTTYTRNGDGWHPNEEGYKKYYVPRIEAFMKTL